jgi:hypothetical protein
VHITINELVLDGFGAIDRKQISSALKLELARLVKENGIPIAVASGNKEIRYIKTQFGAKSHKLADDGAIARDTALSIYRLWE